jgi:hypothetical protein
LLQADLDVVLCLGIQLASESSRRNICCRAIRRLHFAEEIILPEIRFLSPRFLAAPLPIIAMVFITYLVIGIAWEAGFNVMRKLGSGSQESHRTNHQRSRN